MAATLTALEASVLTALHSSSAGNGHDFGFTEDAREAVKSPKQLGAIITSLQKKGYISGVYEVTTDSGTWHQVELGWPGVQDTAEAQAKHVAGEKIGEMLRSLKQPAPEQPTMEERTESTKEAEGFVGYLVAVSGSVNGEPYDNLILVDAPAARFARRYARSELREAGIDTTNLVFNARRA